MKYSDKVKLSKKLYSTMEGMSKDDVLPITYNGKEYEIYCYVYKGLDSKDWTIYEKGKYYISGMNIENKKMGPSSMMAYTYDMMGQKTTYKFKIESIKVGKLESKKK